MDDTEYHENNAGNSNDRSGRVRAELIEGEDLVSMDLDRSETEFPDEEALDEGLADDHEVSFRSSQGSRASARSINNNATHRSLGRLDSDAEGRSTPQMKQGTKRSIVAKRAVRLDDDEREDIIEEAINRFQSILDKSGFLEAAALIKEQFGGKEKSTTPKNRKGKTVNFNKNVFNHMQMIDDPMEGVDQSSSEVTIYRNAVLDHTSK